jgi:hypothetical protein
MFVFRYSSFSHIFFSGRRPQIKLLTYLIPSQTSIYVRRREDAELLVPLWTLGKLSSYIDLPYHLGYLISGRKECIRCCETWMRRCAFDGGGDGGREVPAV